MGVAQRAPFLGGDEGLAQVVGGCGRPCTEVLLVEFVHVDGEVLSRQPCCLVCCNRAVVDAHVIKGALGVAVEALAHKTCP